MAVWDVIMMINFEPLHPQVEAPIDKVYKIWSNRLNYSEWFDLMGQVIPAIPICLTHPCSSSNFTQYSYLHFLHPADVWQALDE